MTSSCWTDRADQLVQRLMEAGALRSPRWQAAFRQVPRHVLVPVYYRPENGTWRKLRTDTPEGMELVYSNAALFVLPGGLSSSSMPGLMARMLDALDVADAHQVLEIGTGAGYNAALLCHGIGSGHVTSVDVEHELVELARRRLAGLGYHPHLEAADGTAGVPHRGPFDRLIATCAVRRVPWPWVAQTRDGGLLLVDLKIAESAGNLVLLRREPGPRAEGRFLSRWGGFMPLRTDTGTARKAPRRDQSDARSRPTTLDRARPWEDLGFWFFLHLHATEQIVSHGQVRDEATGLPGDAFLTAADGSWCEIGQQARLGMREIREGGPGSLWATVEEAERHWTACGRPGWERFGLTVIEAAQVVWLDDPQGTHRWLLRA